MPQDYALSVLWTRKAAEQGYPPAQYNLGTGGAGQPRAPRCGSCSRVGQAIGAELAGKSLENRPLMGRHTTSPALPLRRRTHPPCTSRPQAQPAARAGVAADRVATRRSRTAQILAVQSGQNHPAARSCRSGKTALDHRTRLPGTKTGTRAGPLRRTRLARLPPSRHPPDRRLWLPGGGAVPFFPLGPQRPSWTTCSRTPARIPAPRRASGLSGITLTPSPLCASSCPALCFASYATVRSVAFNVYKTVVLERSAWRSPKPRPTHAALRSQARQNFLWLDSHLVVDGVAKFLFAAQVLIVGLKRYMSFKAMF